jgi:hypothetical protein
MNNVEMIVCFAALSTAIRDRLFAVPLATSAKKRDVLVVLGSSSFGKIRYRSVFSRVFDRLIRLK